MTFKPSPFGQIVWEDRYALKDENGVLLEKDVSETFRRVAKAIASKEKEPQVWEDRFYSLMADKYLCPAGRVLAHSGTHYPQLFNCFVLPFEDDSLEGIMETAKKMATVFKYGGGVGFNYSKLRPSGSYIKGVNGHSCGTIGFIQMMSNISEVIEQGGCLTSDTLINTVDGLFYFNELIKETEQGWYPHDLNVKTKDGDKNSKRYFVNGYSDIIQITTDLGVIEKGTLTHKLYVFTEKGFDWKEIRDIKKGDYLVSKMGQHEGEIQNLDTEIEKDHHNCIVPQLPKRIDNDFAFFLGYYIGNGFSGSRENDYRTGVSIPDKSYLNEKIYGMFEDLFGSDVTVTDMRKPEDQSVTYYVTNKIIKKYLNRNGLLKSKSNTASIPLKIRCSPKEIVGSFLQGLFEADGSVSHNYPELSTSSYKLAKEVQILLLGLGIPCKLRWSRPKKRFSKEMAFHVKVVSFKGLEMWNTFVFPSDKSRFRACKSHKPDLGREQNYKLPHASYWLRDVMENLLSQEKTPEIKKLIKRLKAYIRGSRNLTISAYYDLLENDLVIVSLYKSDIGLPPVDNLLFCQVVNTALSTEPTFDFEVEESHSYIANSLITHNSRRAASLGLLEIWHPDIWEYISYKNDHNWERLAEFIDIKDQEKWQEFKFHNLYKWQMYNVSVGITDEFLDALEKDEVWPLMWNGEEWELYTVEFKKSFGDGDFKTKKFEVTANNDSTALWKVRRDIPFPTVKDKFEVISRRKIKAKELWDLICYNAWADGCPGLINISTARRMHNIEYASPLQSGNPCAEQLLSGYSSCNLLSIILLSLVKRDEKIFDYDKFKEIVELSVRFGDNVIDNCVFPIPEIADKAQKERRVGIGLMGVHDTLIALGLEYDSDEGREFLAGVLEIMRDTAYEASIALAKERGSFPFFNNKKFLKSGFIKTLPKVIRDSINNHGIRNSTLLTQPPTGSISAFHGVSSGCEPWFSLSFTRNTKLGSFEDGCPSYLEWRKKYPNNPKPSYFKTSQEISSEDHIKMLQLFSKYVCSSVSKTINLPNSATVEEVENAFLFSMKNGVKGITVFRDGCKEGVLVNKDKLLKEAKKTVHELQDLKEEIVESRTDPKKRGARTTGATYRIPMQNHNLYITVNRNKNGELVEIFTTVGESKKLNTHHTSGVEDSWAEGLGKVVSLALRAGVEPSAIIRNLKNIPSDKPVFITVGDCGASELVPSPPHAIARVIEEELQYSMEKCTREESVIEGRPCTECGSTKTKPKSPTCYVCLDCGYEACG